MPKPLPTARQSLGEMHETAFIKTVLASNAVCACQLVPSQNSNRGLTAPALST